MEIKHRSTLKQFQMPLGRKQYSWMEAEYVKNLDLRWNSEISVF